MTTESRMEVEMLFDKDKSKKNEKMVIKDR